MTTSMCPSLSFSLIRALLSIYLLYFPNSYSYLSIGVLCFAGLLSCQRHLSKSACEVRDPTQPRPSWHVTELVDAVFIGCSMNHVVGDGTSYWNFFNTWSQIFQSQSHALGHEYDVPIHNRWFPKDCAPPINLPFIHHDEIISRYEAPKLRERIFHF